MVEGATNSSKARIPSLIMTCACCCTVEGTRADANLALDTSMEFYVVMGTAAVTLLVMWEGLCWIWVRVQAWSWNARVESRHARRLRRLQNPFADMGPRSGRLQVPEAVESDVVEIVSSPRERVSGSTRVGPRSTTASTRISSSSKLKRSPSTAMARGTMAMGGHDRDALIRTEDAATQVDGLGFEYLPREPAVARLEIREVFPDEYYMTQHGAHVHVHKNCWGLRNASNIVTRRLCECCRNNEGRSLYDTQT